MVKKKLDQELSKYFNNFKILLNMKILLADTYFLKKMKILIFFKKIKKL